MGHVVLLTSSDNDLFCMQALAPFSIVIHIKSQPVAQADASNLSGSRYASAFMTSANPTSFRTAASTLKHQTPHTSQAMFDHGILPYTGPVPVFGLSSAASKSIPLFPGFTPASSASAGDQSMYPQKRFEELSTTSVDSSEQLKARHVTECTIFEVRSIPPEASEFDLAAHCAKHGRVRGVILDRKVGQVGSWAKDVCERLIASSSYGQGEYYWIAVAFRRSAKPH